MKTERILARAAAIGLAASGLGCGLFSSSSGDFRARFEGRVVEFNCEVQSVHKDAAPTIRPIPPGAGPSGRMMGLDPGKDLVAWLYHFEDDGSVLKDEEFAYSIAVVLKTPKPGTYEFPGERAAILFFCDNWGRGFRACEAKAVEGWLRVDEATERSLRGEFDVRLQGKKERADKTEEEVRLELRGTFAAVP
jgi:hypothetical protein